MAGSDVREIGDVDEGVVEGGEDACHAEDELACDSAMSVCVLSRDLEYVADMAANAPSRTWGPSWTFSCAARVTFCFGAIVAASCVVVKCWLKRMRMVALEASEQIPVVCGARCRRY